MTIKDLAKALGFTQIYVQSIVRQNNIGIIKLVDGKNRRIFTHEDLRKIRQILELKRQKRGEKEVKKTQVVGRLMEDGLVKIYLRKDGTVHTEKHWLCSLEECRERGVEIIN